MATGCVLVMGGHRIYPVVFCDTKLGGRLCVFFICSAITISIRLPAIRSIQTFFK